jgi:hypothetical protein
MQIKPNHPEIVQMIAEASGTSDDFQTMHHVIRYASQLFEHLPMSVEISNKTLASLYHKIAMPYIKVLQLSTLLTKPTHFNLLCFD